MKVNIDISPECREPYAVIHTDKVTDEIQRMIDVFSNSETPVTALQNEEDIVVLQPKEIYMVRVEDGDTIIYGALRARRPAGKTVHADIQDDAHQSVIHGQH